MRFCVLFCFAYRSSYKPPEINTNTVPLHIEVLYNENQFVPAFAVASVLTLLALATLILKTLTTTKRGAA